MAKVHYHYRVLLIGSKRFAPWFEVWGEALRRAGHLPYQLPPAEDGYARERTEREIELAQASLRDQLELADRILLLNAFGYIGDSTREQIQLATSGDQRILCLEHWGAGADSRWPGWISPGRSSARAGVIAAGSLGIHPDYRTPISTMTYASPFTGTMLGEDLAYDRIVQMLRHFESQIIG